MTLMGEIDAATIALRDFLPVHNRTVQSNNNHVHGRSKMLAAMEA